MRATNSTLAIYIVVLYYADYGMMVAGDECIQQFNYYLLVVRRSIAQKGNH